MDPLKGVRWIMVRLMYEFDSLSVSTYEASSLAAKLTEKSSDGWDVVAIVPTGSDITAFLKRSGNGSTSTDSGLVADAGPAESPSGGPAAPTSSWDTGAGTPESAPAAPNEPSGWGSAPESSPSSWGASSGDNSGSSWGSQSSTPASAPASASTPAVPPGWYADPAGRYELRYWDGSAWTEHVSRAGQQYTDPPVA